MLLQADLARFVAWFAAFQGKVEDQVRAFTQAAADELCSCVGEDGSVAGAPRQWLETKARLQLRKVQEGVTLSRTLLGQSQPFVALAQELQGAVQALPESVALNADEASATARDAPTRVEVPLRYFLEVRFLAQAMPAFAELEMLLERALDELTRRLDEIERVLDYYALGVERHTAANEEAFAEEFARTGSTRVRTLIEELYARSLLSSRRTIAVFVDRTASVLEEASRPFRAHQAAEIQRVLHAHEQTREAGPARPTLVRRAVTVVERSSRVILPALSSLGSELSTLFAERGPGAPDDAFRTRVSREPTELGGSLPLSYRRLFSVVPLDSDGLYVRRSGIEDACTAAIVAFRDGAPQAILLHGDRGAGKRTLVSHVLARVRGQASLDVRWIRLGPELRDEAAMTRELGRALGFAPRYEKLRSLSAAVAQASGRRAVVLENAERVLAPTAEGIARMGELLAFVGQTAHNTLWLLMMATPAAAFVLHRLGFAHRIPTVLHVPPMTTQELRRVMGARNELSGFALEFAAPSTPLTELRKNRLFRLGMRTPKELFFERLVALTGGNPRQALYYWLAQVQKHPQREGRVLVNPLPSNDGDWLAPLSLSQRLILALLARHESLAGAEIVQALGQPTSGIEGDLRVLWTRGLIAPLGKGAVAWTLTPTLAHALTLELRALNMI